MIKGQYTVESCGFGNKHFKIVGPAESSHLYRDKATAEDECDRLNIAFALGVASVASPKGKEILTSTIAERCAKEYSMYPVPGGWFYKNGKSAGCRRAFTDGMYYARNNGYLAPSQWISVDIAIPKPGIKVRVKFSYGMTEDDVYWSTDRCCMLGSRAGSYPDGWASTRTGNLPIDDVIEWMPI